MSEKIKISDLDESTETNNGDLIIIVQENSNNELENFKQTRENFLNGTQEEITDDNKLSSDLVDDTDGTNKFVTSEEKAQITTNETAISNITDGTNIDSFGDVETALSTVDTALNAKENTSNKVTSLSSSSTDTEYPSAKLLYDKLEEKQTEINTLTNENTYLNNVIDQIVPKTEYGEGTDITLEDCINARLDWKDSDGVVKTARGDTEQDGIPTPDTPIEIKSVTGTQNVVVSGINEFNPSNVTNGKAINASGDIVDLNYFMISDYIEVENSTQVALSFLPYGGTSNQTTRLHFYDSSKTWLSQEANMASTGDPRQSIITTTPSTCKYVRISIVTAFKEIMFCKGSATTYEPYISITKQLSLGSKELFENSVISKEGDTWYFNDDYYKDMYKNGTIERIQTNTSGKYRFKITFTETPKTPASNSDVANVYSDILLKTSASNTYSRNNGISVATGGYIAFYYSAFEEYTVQNMQDYFANKTDYVVFELASTKKTPITDTTLIEQLEEILKLQSIYGTTVIETNGNLPMIIKVRALKGN